MVSPVGSSAAACWRACLAGQAAVAPIPAAWLRWSPLTSTVWAPLPPVDFEAAGIGPLEAMRLDRSAMLALVAASEALADAGWQTSCVDAKRCIWRLDGLDGTRAGVFMGTGGGGITSLVESTNSHVLSAVRPLTGKNMRLPEGAATEALQELIASLPLRFNPFSVSMVMPNAISAVLGIRYSLRGPNTVSAVACAAGTVAIGHAFRSIRDGETDVALCGGSEYTGDPFGGSFRAFDTAKTLTTGGACPATANRPFDKARTGFLMAEGGAAVLVCEELEHARRRGRPVHAEIVGYGESFDAYSMLVVEPSGEELSRAITGAITDAGITAADVDAVNTHGTGTVINDEVESAVIERLFGQRPLVTATKSLTGHCIGASGAIEAAVTALSLRDQKVHGCVNLQDPVRPLNFARQATDAHLRWAVSQSSAFGGHNAALVLRRAE